MSSKRKANESPTRTTSPVKTSEVSNPQKTVGISPGGVKEPTLKRHKIESAGLQTRGGSVRAGTLDFVNPGTYWTSEPARRRVLVPDESPEGKRLAARGVSSYQEVYLPAAADAGALLDEDVSFIDAPPGETTPPGRSLAGPVPLYQAPFSPGESFVGAAPAVVPQEATVRKLPSPEIKEIVAKNVAIHLEGGEPAPTSSSQSGKSIGSWDLEQETELVENLSYKSPETYPQEVAVPRSAEQSQVPLTASPDPNPAVEALSVKLDLVSLVNQFGLSSIGTDNAVVPVTGQQQQRPPSPEDRPDESDDETSSGSASPGGSGPPGGGGSDPSDSSSDNESDSGNMGDTYRYYYDDAMPLKAAVDTPHPDRIKTEGNPNPAPVTQAEFDVSLQTDLGDDYYSPATGTRAQTGGPGTGGDLTHHLLYFRAPKVHKEELTRRFLEREWRIDELIAKHRTYATFTSGTNRELDFSKAVPKDDQGKPTPEEPGEAIKLQQNFARRYLEVLEIVTQNDKKISGLLKFTSLTPFRTWTEESLRPHFGNIDYLASWLRNRGYEIKEEQEGADIRDKGTKGEGPLQGQVYISGAKLDSIHLNPWNGTHATYPRFWQTFNAMYHKNPKVSWAVKMNALERLLANENEKKTFQRYDFTEEGYQEYIDNLEHRFSPKNTEDALVWKTKAQMIKPVQTGSIDSSRYSVYLKLREYKDYLEECIRNYQRCALAKGESLNPREWWLFLENKVTGNERSEWTNWRQLNRMVKPDEWDKDSDFKKFREWLNTRVEELKNESERERATTSIIKQMGGGTSNNGGKGNGGGPQQPQHNNGGGGGGGQRPRGNRQSRQNTGQNRQNAGQTRQNAGNLATTQQRGNSKGTGNKAGGGASTGGAPAKCPFVLKSGGVCGEPHAPYQCRNEWKEERVWPTIWRTPLCPVCLNHFHPLKLCPLAQNGRSTACGIEEGNKKCPQSHNRRLHRIKYMGRKEWASKYPEEAKKVNNKKEKMNRDVFVTALASLAKAEAAKAATPAK